MSTGEDEKPREETMKRLALTVALAAIAATGFAQQQQVSEGQVLYEQKKYEEAVKVLEKQVQKEP